MAKAALLIVAFFASWTGAAAPAMLISDGSGTADNVALAGLYGIYCGIAAVIALFNLIFWLWLRERSHLGYALYVVTLAFAVLASHGVTEERMAGISITLAFAVGAWFFCTVMGLRSRYPRLQRAIDSVTIFFAASCVAAVAGFYPQIATAVQLMGLALTLAFLVAGFMMLRHGHDELLLYQIAFSVQYAGVIVTAARNLGLLAPGIVADNALLIGSALHMVLLSIALADRIRHAQRALQEQLQGALIVERDAQAMQRQFIATVSHEFRTPLAVIDTTAQTLAFQLTEDVVPDAPRRIDKIRRAVSRLTTLIDNCLSDERLALGGAPLRREDVDLCLLLGTLVEDWRSNAPAPLRLALPADGAAVVVACDKALITIALSNLVDNAVKFSPAGGEIVVALERAGENILLSVSDRGTGIAAEELARVFEKFYRTQAAASMSGAGLGLYLVQQIARRHGGDVEAASILGEGSVFRVILPVVRS